jgi:hypothetical protein
MGAITRNNQRRRAKASPLAHASNPAPARRAQQREAASVALTG